MNNIKILLLGTSLSLIPTLTYAQCVATQDCETLGYTETSCNGGKGVKCPFGNKWACIGITAEQCSELGFTYTCTGTGEKGVGNACNGKYQGCTCDSTYKYTCSGANQTGGSGTACDGKYIACTCSYGYEWKSGSCQKQFSGAKGNLYYCNGKVVGVKTNNMDFYVGMHDLGSCNWECAYDQCYSYSFCSNARGSFPDKKDLLLIYSNKSQVNNLLLANGGKKMTEDWYWSVTSRYNAVNISNGDVYTDYSQDSNNRHHVRPILYSD